VPLVGPPAPGEQLQVLDQPALDAVEAERRQAGRRQLDGEGHPVEAGADLGDAGPVVGGRLEGPGRRRPLDEQRHRVALAGLVGQRQPRHGEDPLERQDEPGPAGGEDPHRRARRQQPLDEHGDAVEQVLAVVEHEDRLGPGQAQEHRLLDRAALPLAHAEPGRHGHGHHRRVADGHEVDEPDAVGHVAGHLGGDGHRQAGLAHATGSEGGDEPVRAHGGDQLGDLRRAAHERREGDGQRGGRRRLGAGPDRGRLPVGWRRAHEGRRHRRQGPTVGDAELAEQRRDVALDRPHGDVQAGGDLGVGQVPGERVEDLGLPGGDTGLGEHLGAVHPKILADAPLRLRGGSVVGP
jgi:hypothetical protein